MSEMMSVFQKQTEDEKITAIIDKYGIGFDDVYIDGKIEGINENKIQNAKNLLARGVNEKIISECIDIPIEEVRKLKREL